MNKKDEFKKLMDEILRELLNEIGKASKPRKDIPPITKSVIDILVNLNEQIAEQKECLNKVSEKMEKIEHDFQLLIGEVQKKAK